MNRRALCPVFVGVAIGGSLPEPAAAQRRIVVESEPACVCSIMFEKVTTLDDADGRAGLAQPMVVQRAPKGGYLVVTFQRQGGTLLFDEAGAFVRQVGRPGQGPDEFGVALAIEPGPADSIYVMDAGNGRIAVLDASLRVARTARVPVSSSWFGVLGDGSVLVLGAISGSGGNRLHLFSPSMAPLRTFLPSPPPGPETVVGLRRRMFVSPGGTVAVSHWEHYTIELWDVRGSHVSTLVREPDWRAPPDAHAESAPGPPAPLQERPFIDSGGRLWTMNHVADKAWFEAFGPVTGPYGLVGQGIAAGAENRYRDSIVEVIDPISGQLLASLRVDPLLTFVAGEGLAWSYREDELGLPFVDLWRLALVGPR